MANQIELFFFDLDFKPKSFLPLTKKVITKKKA